MVSVSCLLTILCRGRLQELKKLCREHFHCFTASSLLLFMCQPVFLGNRNAILKGVNKTYMYIKYTKVCTFNTNIKPLLKYNAVHISTSMQFLLSFYALSKHCTSESGDITGSPCHMMTAAVSLSSLALTLIHPIHASSPHVPTACAE